MQYIAFKAHSGKIHIVPEGSVSFIKEGDQLWALDMKGPPPFKIYHKIVVAPVSRILDAWTEQPSKESK